MLGIPRGTFVSLTLGLRCTKWARLGIPEKVSYFSGGGSANSPGCREKGDQVEAPIQGKNGCYL